MNSARLLSGFIQFAVKSFYLSGVFDGCNVANGRKMHLVCMLAKCTLVDFIFGMSDSLTQRNQIVLCRE
uniref:Secreted protein n=1 Tax=Heterorhabditis bacteriophora TaxID=37862 RepID=A0A1I7XA67_HETBA